VFGEEVPRPLQEVSDPVSFVSVVDNTTPQADTMVSPDSTGTVGHQSDSTDKKPVIDSAAPSISIGTQSVNMEPSAVDTGHQFFLGGPEVVSFSSLVAASVRRESDSEKDMSQLLVPSSGFSTWRENIERSDPASRELQAAASQELEPAASQDFESATSQDVGATVPAKIKPSLERSAPKAPVSSQLKTARAQAVKKEVSPRDPAITSQQLKAPAVSSNQKIATRPELMAPVPRKHSVVLPPDPKVLVPQKNKTAVPQDFKATGVQSSKATVSQNVKEPVPSKNKAVPFPDMKSTVPQTNKAAVPQDI